jgi:hypothetical protein
MTRRGTEDNRRPAEPLNGGARVSGRERLAVKYSEKQRWLRASCKNASALAYSSHRRVVDSANIGNRRLRRVWNWIKKQPKGRETINRVLRYSIHTLADHDLPHAHSYQRRRGIFPLAHFIVPDPPGLQNCRFLGRAGSPNQCRCRSGKPGADAAGGVLSHTPCITSLQPFEIQIALPLDVT